MKELLSAFLDNELSEHEERRLLRALSADPELRSTWERYHLAQQALRRELGPLLANGFAARVAAGLPDSAAPCGDAAAARAVAFPAALKLAGFLAAAASVAALTLFGWQALYAPKETSAPALTTAEARHVVRAGSMRWNTDRREAETALNMYLVEHNEFAPTSGVSGMLPYVRVVSYDSER